MKMALCILKKILQETILLAEAALMSLTGGRVSAAAVRDKDSYLDSSFQDSSRSFRQS
jgi:hypothetical protein